MARAANRSPKEQLEECRGRMQEGDKARVALEYIDLWRKDTERDILIDLSTTTDLVGLQAYYKAIISLEKRIKTDIARGKSAGKKMEEI